MDCNSVLPQNVPALILVQIRASEIAPSTFVPQREFARQNGGLLPSENNFTLPHGKLSMKERVKTHKSNHLVRNLRYVF